MSDQSGPTRRIWPVIALAVAIVAVAILASRLWLLRSDATEPSNATSAGTRASTGYRLGQPPADGYPTAKHRAVAALGPDEMRITLVPSFMTEIFIITLNPSGAGQPATATLSRVPSFPAKASAARQPASGAALPLTDLRYRAVVGRIDALLAPKPTARPKEISFCLDGTAVLVERAQAGRQFWAQGSCEDGYPEIAALLHHLMRTELAISDLPTNADWIDP